MNFTIEDYFIDEAFHEDKKKYLILIIYDIVDNKRRNKFSKYLEQFGFRVQKSCFEAKLYNNKYEKLIHGIESFATQEDNIRVYKLNGYGEVRSWGSCNNIADDEVIII